MANPAPSVANEPLQIQQVDPQMLNIAPPVYIFNVGPDQQIKTLGGLGSFIVPACPKGARVSKPLVITGLHAEQRNLGDAVVQNYLHGMVIARDIMGFVSSLPTKHEFTTNLEWKGCFISNSPNPTDEEVAQANAKRREMLSWFVEDGDRRSLMGPGDNGTGGIGPNHRNAVSELKLKREWATSVIAQEECPACGSAVKSNIAVCPKCTAVLNEDLARKFFPERFQTQQAPIAATEPEAQKEAPTEPEAKKPIYDRNKASK